MQGNVQEWSQDWYGGDYSTDAVVDPKGPSTGEKFVIRGGDYRDDAIDGRAASRIMGGIHAKSVDLGFRVVFSAETLGGQPMVISR
jgi:formylglycine-generating enzyme required for sulfatase activity